MEIKKLADHTYVMYIIHAMTENTNLIGILNIDKPAGLTSHDAVSRVRRTTGIKRVGHTGTLDPFATGVLLVALGPATRLIQFSHAWDKEYEATFILGSTSDTDDLTGEIQKLAIKKLPDEQIIKKKLRQFIGNIEQTPPAYSAVKIAGRKLYERARIGDRVVAPARPVTVHEIKIISYQYPELKLNIRCGTGTYIRAIARDLGSALETGAYVSQLQRTRIGKFHILSSIKLDELSTDNLHKAINPPETLVSHLTRISLSSTNVAQLRQGKKTLLLSDYDNIPNNQPLTLFDPDKKLIGIGYYDSSTRLLSPRVILPSF